MKAIILSVVLGLGIILGIYYVSLNNEEIEVRNLAINQQLNCESYFDKMFKVLKQQAGVTDQYKESFKEIYIGIMEGRYSGEKGDALMKWVHEANPQFDASLYGKLMNSIEAQREGFFNEQKKLISIKNTHDNLIMKFPASLFLGSRGQLEIKIITSAATKLVYETGEENDIDLFN